MGWERITSCSGNFAPMRCFAVHASQGGTVVATDRHSIQIRPKRALLSGTCGKRNCQTSTGKKSKKKKLVSEDLEPQCSWRLLALAELRTTMDGVSTSCSEPEPSGCLLSSRRGE
ncbi:unnamed protein product [Lota lota]